MNPDALAALHAACFTTPRPWSAQEFAALLATPHCFLLEEPGGFLLGRAIADEAELLTLAVDPALRRGGIARLLVRRFAETAAQRGATHAFLEVAEENGPARALYDSLGWKGAGRRRGYYTTLDGKACDALVLHWPIGTPRPRFLPPRDR